MALPPGFPCALPPTVLESKLPPDSMLPHAPSGEEWPAQCLNLRQQSAESTLQQCAEVCSTEPTCNVWQLTEASACWGGDGTPTGVLGGQRIQHGTIRVNSVLDSGSWYE